MPEKKTVQDIVPIKVHRIAPSGTATRYSAIQKANKAEKPEPPPFQHFKKPKRRKNPRRRKILLILFLIVACFAAVIAAITFVYAKAVVIILPKTEDVSVNGTFSAGESGTPLTYQVIQTTEVATTSVPVIQGSLVSSKAWGQVILYNAYSSTPQKLLIGTRLSNDAGLIYTTASAVTIPGEHGTAAGSVSVYVVAQTAGSQYNIAPTDLTGDFKIVAFQGTPKADGFYGRLKPGNAIVGGYAGYREIVATSTLVSTTAALTQTVSSALAGDIKALVPDGYVMYNGAYGMNFASTTLTAVSTTSPTAVATVKGTLYGIMFKKVDLAKAVAPAQVAEFPPGQFVVNGIESLKFAPTNQAGFSQSLAMANGSANAQGIGTVSFSLSGSFNMVGIFPSDALAQGLVGLSVAESKAVFAKYSTIMSAHAIITPLWKHSFPSSADKITIDIQQ